MVLCATRISAQVKLCAAHGSLFAENRCSAPFSFVKHCDRSRHMRTFWRRAANDRFKHKAMGAINHAVNRQTD